MVDTPREMIRLNCPNGIGIQGVVLWVRITKHQNQNIANPQPLGLLKIVEVGLDGQVLNAVFSENGVKAFVDMADPGFRNTEFEVTSASRKALA